MRYFIPFLLIAICCNSPSKKKPIVLEEVSLGVEENTDYPEFLSEWEFFEEPLRDLRSNKADIFPYEINSPLFSDYAHKSRYIKLPENAKIDYSESEVLGFPKGTVLIKNFFYPGDFRNPEKDVRILETRLLIHEEQGWKAIVYEWNEEQSDAQRIILGKQVPVEWKDEKGVLQRVNYSIPSQPQCKSCHDQNGKMTPIGPSVRQLNRDSQLISWQEKGLLELPMDHELPLLPDYRNRNLSLDTRARAWLEINCAHCHRKEGPAKNSGLYLLASEADDYRIGVNKPPIAAGKGSGGLKYSIVPRHPKQSILVHRIESLEPGEMMPEVGRKMKNEEGIALIRDWIAAMD